MKISIVLSTLALFVAVASFVESHRMAAKVDQQAIEAASSKALREREKILVEN